jgi:putative hydrolase of the HAD superfamily
VGPHQIKNWFYECRAFFIFMSELKNQRKMNKVQNIIFDLGGVLLNIDYNLTREAFAKLGVEHFDEMYSQATADKLFQKLETGEISEENFYKELNRCTGLNLSPVEIQQAWNAMLLDFREKSLEFLDQIKGKYKLFLLSNTNFIHMEAFNKIYHSRPRDKEFDSYFNKAFYSCRMGFRKPDDVCYACLINEVNINPEKTLFIDDSLGNIAAAKRAKMQTIHLLAGTNIEDLGL